MVIESTLAYVKYSHDCLGLAVTGKCSQQDCFAAIEETVIPRRAQSHGERVPGVPQSLFESPLAEWCWMCARCYQWNLIELDWTWFNLIEYYSEVASSVVNCCPIHLDSSGRDPERRIAWLSLLSKVSLWMIWAFSHLRLSLSLSFSFFARLD